MVNYLPIPSPFARVSESIISPGNLVEGEGKEEGLLKISSSQTIVVMKAFFLISKYLIRNIPKLNIIYISYNYTKLI